MFECFNVSVAYCRPVIPSGLDYSRIVPFFQWHFFYIPQQDIPSQKMCVKNTVENLFYNV